MCFIDICPILLAVLIFLTLSFKKAKRIFLINSNLLMFLLYKAHKFGFLFKKSLKLKVDRISLLFFS